MPETFQGNVWGLYQTFMGMPLYTLVRFGKWDDILAEPAPPEHARYLTGMRHYARGLAYTHTDRVKKAGKEIKALRRLAEDPSLAEAGSGLNKVRQLLTIATEVLAGEMAAARGDFDEALGHLERAVRLEDGQNYNEPPDWFEPVRHVLGAVLMESGRPGEAEVVYWQDLKKNRENGFALFGLWQSLEAQGRTEEATSIRARFDAAWKDADVKLASSRY